MNIVILGPQGSGKGTQAQKLAEFFHLEHIDMGKSLREVAKQNTPLGKEIYHIQNVTKTLVPSRILKEVLHLKIGSIPREQGIIFEGVPRNMDQSQYVEELLLEFGRKINRVILIKVSQEETFKRISKRWVCDKCKAVLIMGKDILSEKDQCPYCEGEIMQRLDDTPEGIEKRLQVFEEETIPVISYFKEKGLVSEINGEQSPEEVFSDILKILENISGN